MNGLFRLTLRQMLGGMKIWLVAVFLSLPILLLGAVLFARGFAFTADDANHIDPKAEEGVAAVFLYVLYPQGLCILASLIYGATLLAGEIEDKTLVYLFTRAQPRWKILLGKYLATSLVLGCMTSASMLLCFALAGAPYGASLLWALLATIFAACFAYTALFALLGLAVPRRALTIGLIYAVLVEFILSLVPALVNEATASYYLRSMAYHIANVKGIPLDALDMLGDASLTRAVTAVVLIPVVALVLCGIVLHRKEWPLTEGV